METAEILKQLTEITGKIATLTQVIVTKEQQGKDEPWVNTATALKALGEAFGRDKLMDDIAQGYLKHGFHYVNLSNGAKANYGFRVSALRELYATPPERRKVYR